MICLASSQNLAPIIINNQKHMCLFSDLFEINTIIETQREDVKQSYQRELKAKSYS